MKYYIKVAIEHFGFGLMIPISIAWKLQSGLSIGQAAFTESLILLTTALFEVPAGFIADKISNKKSLLIGAVFQAAATIFLAAGNSLTIFVIAAILSGTGWAFSTGADEAYVHDDLLKDKRQYQKTFANITIVDEAATVMGMAFSSLLLLVVDDLRWPLIVAAALLAVHACYVQFGLPHSRRHVTNTESLYMTWRSVRKALRQTVPLLPLLVALALIYESGRILWQPHMENIGLSVASFGLVFALYKGAAIVGSILARHKDFGLRDLLVAFPVMLIALVSFGLDQKVVSIVALTIFLATENYFRVYMSTILNRMITDQRAAMLSLASSTRNILGGGLVWAAGAVATRSIQLALIVLALAKLPAVAYLLYTHYRVRTHKDVSLDEPASI